MADGPNVAQIIKKRETDIAACEATGKAERAQVEGSYTLNLPALDYVTGLFTRGPSGLRAKQLGPIQIKEHLCKYKANLDADSGFAIREVTLEAKMLEINGAVQGKSLAIDGANTAIEGYRRALEKTLRRAQVAEMVAAECLVTPRKDPDPLRDNRSLLIASKKP